MDEARKTNEIRSEDFKRTYFAGRIIDIGCGPDLVVPEAVPFDLAQGDAQRILEYFAPGSFDCVHSSHCLEHMSDVRAALSGWWALVKPGGYLIIVVPDEDLYEQGAWPSLFNSDHKATFRIGKSESWSPVSYDIEALAKALPGADVIDARVQDHGYDRKLLRRLTKARLLLFRLGLQRRGLFERLMHAGVPAYQVNLALDRLERMLGKPFDQTMGTALAQIQVVVRKQEGHTNSAL